MRRALLTAILATAACGKNTLMAQIDGATLPECDDLVPAADGPTIVIWPDSHEELYTLPTGPVVRIAADRAVSWRRVKQLAARLERQGSRPVLLVGRGVTNEIGAFVPTEPLHPGKHLVLDAGKDGEFFVGDAEKGTRVKAFDHEHIAKSFIREAMPPIVKQSGVHDVEVRVDVHMNWADMVRAIDGARTCCGAKAAITVSIEDLEL
jgi:biopolymer transport protein ExbD